MGRRFAAYIGQVAGSSPAGPTKKFNGLLDLILLRQDRRTRKRPLFVRERSEYRVSGLLIANSERLRERTSGGAPPTAQIDHQTASANAVRPPFRAPRSRPTRAGHEDLDGDLARTRESGPRIKRQQAEQSPHCKPLPDHLPRDDMRSISRQDLHLLRRCAARLRGKRW